MRLNRRVISFFLSLLMVTAVLSAGLPAGQEETAVSNKRPLTLQDMMEFKSIEETVISDDGKWLAYTVQPDRGNGEVWVYRLGDKNEPYERIPRGKKPVISKDSRRIAVLIAPDAKELEKKELEKKGWRKKELEEKEDEEIEILPTGMALLDTVTGKLLTMANVKSFSFSENSLWMVYHHYPENEKSEVPRGEKQTAEKKKGDKWAKRAFTMVLHHLASGKEIRIESVLHYALDPSPDVRYLAYSLYNGEGKDNGLFVRNLETAEAAEKRIHSEIDALYTNLTWSKTKSRLAFILHRLKEAKEDRKTFSSGLWVWDGIKDKHHSAVPREKIPRGWMIPADNKLQWAEDGERLFFGFKPYDEYIRTIEAKTDRNNDEEEETDGTEEAMSFFNVQKILEKRGVDVWHWNDPTIIPQQKKQWKKFRKRIYPAVYHFQAKYFVLLADKVMPELDIPENPDAALGFSDRPYLREMTWNSRYRDYYISRLNTGFRRKILTRQQFDVSLSPGGRYAVYYKDKHWYLYDVRLKFPRRLTGAIKTPFFNEDHDYPSDVPGYGIGGWTENDRSVIIYDKYDIWEFFPGSNVNRFICVTEGKGRQNKLIFRIQTLDPEAKFFKKNEKLLLTAYSDEEKYTAFYRGTVGKPGVEELIREKKKFTFLTKAKEADRIIYTRESFEEFPDIRVSDFDFKSVQKVTDVNPRLKEFLWGTPELIEWKALDGTRLQGVVIKPENFDSTERYPVLVYFYRFFSQQLYDFNPVVINHRPCFPYYTGHGYVIFLPDIRFEIGHPGRSAFQCIVPGVQKLIDMGIADPKAVGIHGHSWSGYQTAFIITQTNMFAAAVAGAPVANMTSAYSGIRWGSGLARQFQYEKSQSRIGKSLWEDPELYIENSPVFFAHRVETPLLVQFGDEDGAVPWYQGIELYLAMRRLNKNCIFLQYNDEPHHLKRYPNKLDYTIKMKEFLDHYLKGQPAPDWITKGVPYNKR